ncbi:MAG TPA: hypothetical protein VJ861_11730 [Treponemataceae bacterium]|nr:hypothetical protein [Treponemataceae bacterium]
MKKKLEIRNQKDFDAFRATKDSAYIANLQGKFLETRLLLLEEQPETWLTLNPLFPRIAEKLRALSRSENVFILSTKNEDLIGLILKHHKIDWPDSRIINALNRDKIKIIESHTSFEKSIFIDDQLDHLVWDNKKVICYLALWGYLDKNSVPNVPSLEYETFLETIESLAGS